MSQKMPFSNLFMGSMNFGWQKLMTVFKALIIPLIIAGIGIFIIIMSLIDFGYFIGNVEDLEYATGPGEVLAFFGETLRTDWKIALAILIIGSTLVSLPIYNGYTKLSRYIGLGEEPQNWWAPSLDGPTWRMFFAHIIYGLLIQAGYALGFWIAYLMNPEIFSSFGDLVDFEHDPSVVLPFLGFFFTGFGIGFIINIIIGTKLAPFTAASACENRLMLINSWSRTKGHFWTILSSYIVLSLVIGVISMMLDLVFQVFTTTGTLMGDIGLLLVAIVTVVYIVAQIIFAFFQMGVMIAFPALIYKYLWQE
jgi:hypothetical protein